MGRWDAERPGRAAQTGDGRDAARSDNVYDPAGSVRSIGEIDAEDSAREWILRVYHYDSSGNYLNQYVNVAQGGGLSTTWQQRGGRFTTPANGGIVKVEPLNYMTSGLVACDDVSLN